MAKKIDYSNGIYNAREQLGWPRTIVLGFQHMFAMFGATVLVPIITGLSISVTLFCAGVGTLLFHLITKRKVPAFLGSSFAFLGGFAVICGGSAADPGFDASMLPYACGGVVIAGLVYLVLSGAITAFGIKRVMKLFPPVVTGPIIVLIGLILAPSAVGNVQKCWWLGVITMLIIIGCAVFGKGMVGIIPILLGVAGGYLIGAITGQVNIAAAPIFGLPAFSLPKFSGSAILTMAPIALATMMEHIGDISAIGATCHRNFLANPGLHRTLIGDGLATSMAGLIGGPANTTYGENTGVLVLSKVYDPFVIRIAALLAVVLSFFPIFENVISAMPVAVIGGASFILYGMISAIGVRNMVENHVDLTKQRNLMIAAVILVSGLGINGIGGLQLGPVNLSGLACAAIFGIVLNAILPGKDYEFSMEEMDQEPAKK